MTIDAFGAVRTPPAASARRSASFYLSGALVVLVGFDYSVYRTLGIATVLGLVLAPVWWPAVSRFRGGWPVLGTGAVAAASGVWLTEYSSLDHRTSTALMVSVSFILLNILVGIGILLWARTHLRTSLVAVLLGLGMVLAIPVGGVRLDQDAWRFEYSVPVSVLLLALAWHARRPWLEVVLALALAGASALAGGRSTFAMLLVAAIASAWQMTRSRTKVGSRVRIVLFGGALVFALYQVGQGLILDGYLGESAQARTEMQIQTSGNVLLGARPELGATLALMASEPGGFGSGTLSSLADIRVAKSGMAQLGYDPDNGYVHKYMFGNGYELHSVIGDMWAAFGIAGLAFTVLAVLYGFRSALGLVASRAAPALLVYLTVRMTWNALFGPVLASSTLLAAAVGLLLALKVAGAPPGLVLLDPPTESREEPPARTA